MAALVSGHARELFVLLCICVGGLAAGHYVSSKPRTYQANAQIFVTTHETTVGQLGAGQTFVQSQMQSYVSIVTSPSVLTPVSKDPMVGIDGSQLGGKVSADAPLDQVLLNIHARDSSAARAAVIANSVAEHTIVAIGKIQGSAIEMTIIHRAVPPSAPVGTQKELIFIVGLLGGLFIGLVVVVGRERFVARVRTTRDLDAVTGLPVLGLIPNERVPRPLRDLADVRAASPRAEAFRQLRTNLQFVEVDRPPKVLAVTSGVTGEGKTSVAVNLAVSLANVGFSVCLIEANLRAPSLARVFSLPDHDGLTSLLVAGAASRAGGAGANGDIEQQVPSIDRNLWVITSGPLPPNPSDLLASRQLKSVISDLRERFDYLVLDTASLLATADGAEVIAAADAVLLVVRARTTTRQQFLASLEAIERVDGSIAGLVFYRAPLPAARGLLLRRLRG